MPINDGALRLGPCNIYLFENSADVNVGYVESVEISITPQMANLMGGQAGVTPIDKVVTGVEGKVSFLIQQIELAGWRRALLGVAQAFQGVTTPANKRLEIQSRAGQSMRALAKKMTIKPIYGGAETTDVTEVLVVPFAAPDAETITLVLNSSTQETIKALYYMFPDSTKRNRILYFGDDASDTSAAATW
jgi:hypothetical protein